LFVFTPLKKFGCIFKMQLIFLSRKPGAESFSA